MPLVGVIVGSKSDDSVIQDTVSILEELGISHELSVISAHRTPEKAREYAKSALEKGLEVIIAAAGGSAALPGVMASWTTLPVIGVPLASSELNGVDALHAIAQMPPGVPVACMSIGSWGARNAAYMAAAILSLKHTDIRKAYEGYREDLANS
tara:strand:+ start:159 stop:617 length:459 start_codon:yes stop_codon:yes gene_type:complete